MNVSKDGSKDFFKPNEMQKINNDEYSCLVEKSILYIDTVTQSFLPKLGQLLILRLCGYKRYGGLQSHDHFRYEQRLTLSGISLIS